MNFSQVMRVLWARKGLLLSVLSAIVALVLTVSLLLPKTYVATVALVADSKGTDPVTGGAVPSQLMTSYLTTQMDIIASRNVALKVVDKYKLVDIPDVRAQFEASNFVQGSIRDWLADILLDNLEVRPSRDSNVFSIRFSSADANYAAELANAFADAYIQTSIELKLDPAKRQAAWFDDQVLELRKAWEVAQLKLSEFQKTSTLATTDDRLDVETARLAGISNELVGAQAAMSDAQTRQSQMLLALSKNRLEELPDILGNGLLQSMKADLTRAEGKLSVAGERFGRNHPQYISASAEVTTLRNRLADELNTAKGAIGQAAEIAKQRKVEMEHALDAQKRRILELKRSTDERDVLTREAQSAQLAYQAASQRASSVRLESQLDQSNVAVLNKAIVPIKPASPRILLNLVLAVFVGTLLGAGTVLCAEMLDRRVRSAADVFEASGLIVLVELPSAPRKLRRSRRKQATLIPIRPVQPA